MAEARADDPRIGATLAGKYAITRLIGRGAFGAIPGGPQATLEQVSDACFVLDDQDQFSGHGSIKHRSFICDRGFGKKAKSGKWKEKLEPDSLLFAPACVNRTSNQSMRARGECYFGGGIIPGIPPIPGIWPVTVDVPEKQRIDEVESLVFNST